MTNEELSERWQLSARELHHALSSPATTRHEATTRVLTRIRMRCDEIIRAYAQITGDPRARVSLIRRLDMERWALMSIMAQYGLRDLKQQAYEHREFALFKGRQRRDRLAVLHRDFNEQLRSLDEPYYRYNALSQRMFGLGSSLIRKRFADLDSDQTMVEVSRTFFYVFGNYWRLSQGHNPLEGMDEHSARRVAAEHLIRGFGSGLTTVIRMAEALPRVLALHNLPMDDHNQRSIGTSDAIKSQARIRGTFGHAIERILAGCTSECYSESALEIQRGPHAQVFTQLFGNDIKTFDSQHAFTVPYHAARLAMFGTDASDAIMWPSFDPALVADPKTGTPPALGPRWREEFGCPATLWRIIPTVMELTAIAVSASTLSGHAHHVASSRVAQSGAVTQSIRPIQERVLLEPSPDAPAPYIQTVRAASDDHAAAAGPIEAGSPNDPGFASVTPL